MNKSFKHILVTLIIIFAFVQVFCINKIDKEKNTKVYNTQNIIYTHKTLKEFNEELNCLHEKNIISVKETNEKWYIKLKIKGNKEELLNEMKKLETYNINNYSINKNKDENSIVLEISSKENV